MKKVLLLVALCIGSASSVASAKTLDTLNVEGLVINPQSVVRNAIGLQKGDTISLDVIGESIQKLYRLGLFKRVDFFLDRETDSSAAITLKIEEFPVIEAIEFSGNKKFKKDELLEKIKLKKGQTVSDAAAFDNSALIKKLYAEKGYLRLEIATELKPTKIPGNVTLKFLIKENQKVAIKSVSFTGNVDIKESKLKGKFKTKAKSLFNSGDYDEELYRAHLDTLVMYYNDLGYLDARIEGDSVWYSSNNKDLYVRINVKEGKKYYAGNFYFTGNTVISSDFLSGLIALKPGKPFEKTRFDLTSYSIDKAYRDEGYLWADIKDSRSMRGDTVDVTFSVVENRPAIVNKVDITGNDKTHEKVIRRELTLFPGQKYRQSQVERSMRELNILGFFGDVKPDLKPNEDGTIDIVFNVPEKDNIGQLSLGASYSQYEKFGGNFKTSIPNFRGLGQSLTLDLEYFKTRQNISLTFMEPWAFDTPTRLTTSLSFVRQDYDTNKTNQTIGISFGAGRRVSWPDDYFSVSGSYYFGHTRDYSLAPPPVNNVIVEPIGYESKVSATISRDDRDYPVFPNQGSEFYVTTELSGLGGDYRYVKTTSGYNMYFPLFLNLVSGLKSKFGLMSNLGDNIITSEKNFFAAGGDFYWDSYGAQIRGYPSGRDFGGTPQNGLALLDFSAELRYPILPQQLYVGVFSDMGNVWGKLADVDMGDLYKSVGFGLRLQVPMLGILGFDFAWGLNPWGYEDSKQDSHFNTTPHGFEFHFQFGRGF